MLTTPGAGGDPAGTIEEQFLALICSDEELLQAEFDAIITAEWPSPPPITPRRGVADGSPASGATRWAAAADAGRVARQRHAGIGGWARQRSPPPAATTPKQRNHLASRAEAVLTLWSRSHGRDHSHHPRETCRP